jgi:hypothetical protein
VPAVPPDAPPAPALPPFAPPAPAVDPPAPPVPPVAPPVPPVVPPEPPVPASVVPPPAPPFPVPAAPPVPVGASAPPPPPFASVAASRLPPLAPLEPAAPSLEKGSPPQATSKSVKDPTRKTKPEARKLPRFNPRFYHLNAPACSSCPKAFDIAHCRQCRKVCDAAACALGSKCVVCNRRLRAAPWSSRDYDIARARLFSTVSRSSLESS